MKNWKERILERLAERGEWIALAARNGGMVNLTPHAIVVRLPDGRDRTFAPSGRLARVATVEVSAESLDGVPTIYRRTAQAEGLPPLPGYGEEPIPALVSAMVLAACPGRDGLFAPDSGPTAIRNDAGQVVAVTRLVRA